MYKFILGALTGAAIGMLLAPKAGDELREDLSERMNDSIEHGKKTARRVARQAREFGDMAQDKMQQAKDAIS